MNARQSVAIRLARAYEIPALAALRRTDRAVDAVDDDPAFETRFAAWFVAEGDRRLTWVAEVAGALVGCVSLFDYRRMPTPGRADSGWGYLARAIPFYERAGFVDAGEGAGRDHLMVRRGPSA